ncbi:zinc finger protein ZIC 3 [Acyrthosiphon pisum]|uniref:C2H2-type domain-containing protein n=1 Tax=Acyrthosiphon pisum TaxID=7029 RepID=A0A8R2A564_ACYPI|nr:zinc finger protein ZIC 3 [Acyrthosiphon pisum]|eukprot:XP_003241349.1 PREDICTED: uncharacterized protein LOC100575963 [Acyrthosiphon pisum]
MAKKPPKENIIPPIAPRERPYCPRTMVRYDKSLEPYPTKWVCRMCLKMLLSKEAVKNHLINCNARSSQNQANQAPPSNKDTPYICKYCDKVFSRRLPLKRHLEVHEKADSTQNNLKTKGHDNND